MKKYTKTILLSISSILFLTWAVPLVHNEILTLMHGKEFKDKYKDNNYYVDTTKLESMKVIKYNESEAKIHYVIEGNVIGDLNTYTKDLSTGEWVLKISDCIWSTSGTADNLLWPYFWHAVYFLW